MFDKTLRNFKRKKLLHKKIKHYVILMPYSKEKNMQTLNPKDKKCVIIFLNLKLL